MFSSATYTARRSRLKKDISSDIILLPGNPLLPFNYTANTFPFRQDGNFLYFAGHDLPGLYLTIDADSGAEMLWGHDPTIDDVIWEGPLPSLSELAASVGIQKTGAASELGSFISNAVRNGRKIHFIAPYHGALQIELSEWLGNKPLVSSEALIMAIVAQRSYKSAEEIAEMEKAHAITHQIYRFAMGNTRAGKYEYEIVGGLEGVAKANNGQMAYHPIFSVNGHVLHNHYHGNQMKDGQWIVADLGAENVLHYASDLTRTWPVNGKFTPVQRDIYQIVLAAYQRPATALRPGITYRECHLMAWETIADGLKNMGILKGDPAEMTALGVPGLFMPHGLGHMIGLDVHDMENLGEQYVGYTPGLERSTLLGLKSLRLARALETGFVLTVEPGIYFVPPLIDQWEAAGKFTDFINYSRLKDFRDEGGCRIEDNYLITENGSRMLGQPVARTIDEVEVLVGGLS
jgi:Xaa-Pro aminopeptidase